MVSDAVTTAIIGGICFGVGVPYEHFANIGPVVAWIGAIIGSAWVTYLDSRRA